MRLVLPRVTLKYGSLALALHVTAWLGGGSALAANWHLGFHGVPIATGSTRFSNAYLGTGYSLSLSRQILVQEAAVWVEGRTHGSADWLAAGGRYFVWGGPNLPSVSQGREVELSVRMAGLFLDAGIAYFRASELMTAGTKLSGEGLGLVANVGFNYPLFWRLAAEVKAGTCNTIDAPLTTYYTTVGLDFTF